MDDCGDAVQHGFNACVAIECHACLGTIKGFVQVAERLLGALWLLDESALQGHRMGSEEDGKPMDGFSLSCDMLIPRHHVHSLQAGVTGYLSYQEDVFATFSPWLHQVTEVLLEPSAGVFLTSNEPAVSIESVPRQRIPAEPVSKVGALHD